jgi:hypothetical protein
MAGAELTLGGRRDWPLANPWAWMAAGLLTAVAALVFTRVFGTGAERVSATLVVVGMLAAGTALALRLSSDGPARLERLAPTTRGLVLFLLTALCGALALAPTLIFVFSFLDWSWFPWRPGAAFLIWLVVTPVGAGAAARLHLRSRRVPVSREEEAAALLVVAAVTAFVGCFALYFGAGAALEWDTLRIFLAAATAVALLAAPLAAAPQRIRRYALSLMFVLHFGGIMTASLAAPPAPWIVGQLWNRIYRPYLEFMYLNNAYHFYAPEPGPASYVWFRQIFEDEEGKEQGSWYKIPRINDKGWQQHPVSLEYQRYLALTENVTASDTAPPFLGMNAQGRQDFAPFYRARLEHSPQPLVIGKEKPNLVVPFHPFLTHQQQYSYPSATTKRLLASYARHACQIPNPDHPEWKIKAVKVYRVRHEIPPVEPFAHGRLAADDPELYRPFYMGTFNPEGKLLDPEDPFLYWLLPVLRDQTIDPQSPITDYTRLHAGDPRYISPSAAPGAPRIWVDGPQR